jgi:archaeosine-15-forming tRNA-guanine transglycosylase
VNQSAPRFGLELVSLTVQSVDPLDLQIAEAMRRRESARILEQTELLNQQARVAAARAKIDADEQIALSEHELELKKYGLREAEVEKEALLAQKRTEDELKRGRMRLAYEQEEMALLKNSPELLLLSPQAARLAEASQNLKNARTIVSLWSSDAERESRLSNLFQRFLELVLEGDTRQLKAKGESEGS